MIHTISILSILCLPQNLTFLFFSRSFILLAFTYMSRIHFKLISVYGLRQGSRFLFLHTVISLFQHHLLKSFFPLNYLGTFVESQLNGIYVGLFLPPYPFLSLSLSHCLVPVALYKVWGSASFSSHVLCQSGPEVGPVGDCPSRNESWPSLIAQVTCICMI